MAAHHDRTWAQTRASMTDMVFSADALDANRSGRLSEAQVRELQSGLDFKHKGILGSVVRGFDRLAKDVQDQALPDVSMESARQALAGWGAALKGHDKVGAAEARAQLDAMKRAAEKFVPKDVPSPGRQEPEVLAKAIVGSWRSPFLSVSFEEDGRLAARLADGSDHEGRWSVDPEGRLHADVMGAPVVGQAFVATDELTLVLNDQAVMLQRAAGGSRLRASARQRVPAYTGRPNRS